MTRHFLITGGAGFIGSNYVNRLLTRGEQVTIFDNLSRKGAANNIQWLRETHGEHAFTLVIGDIIDENLIREAVRDIDVVVHLAGQVAVTTSVNQPRMDFESNAIGTFNLLEAARISDSRPIILYSSTNKVYGGMETVRVVEEKTRYRYADYPLGVPETYPLDFHSPYGCSKGTGDQYMRDYARIYGLRTVVFRQSCIYGPRQFGIEDQGWLAWFVIAAIIGKSITIYGNGKQVRDVLYIEDLMDVFDAGVEKIDKVSGEIFNIGGGPENTLSVWQEFGPMLERQLGKSIPTKWGEWRPGDQSIYVSDIRKAERELSWRPQTKVEDGIAKLIQWVMANRDLFH
ncbi:MAG: GDP-mannose 4,6-dehydratase [Anaerolineales bacterium]|nr:GDP-mannose 4,6-dehydratase [Anaerolineales bacterium]